MQSRKSHDYVKAALDHAAASIHHPACEARNRRRAFPLCDCHVGKARFALTFYMVAKDGSGFFMGQYATADELKAEIGGAWVIARKTPRILARYGADVVCLSKKAYADAENRALARRAERMGVKL